MKKEYITLAHATKSVADPRLLQRIDEVLKRPQTSENCDLVNLASAMKKMLPPELLQEVIDHMDPLSRFMRELREQDV